MAQQQGLEILHGELQAARSEAAEFRQELQADLVGNGFKIVSSFVGSFKQPVQKLQSSGKSSWQKLLLVGKRRST